MLQDADGNAEKKWTFQTDSTQLNAGLVTAYQEYDLPSGNLRLENDYTWQATPTSGKPFIYQVVTTMDRVSKKTIQNLGQYGNLTQMLAYDWGAQSVTRTYTNTYLVGGTGGYSSSYNTYYIFNRLLTGTVTDGTKSTVLVTNTYDNGATTFTNQSGIQEHDSKMNTTWSSRGVVLTSTTPSATTTYQYDIAGNVTQATKNGVQTTVTTSSGTNFAAGGAGSHSCGVQDSLH
jgi:YD repeat-containing protein